MVQNGERDRTIFADKACLARPEYRLKRAWYILTKNKNKAEILKHIFTLLRTKFKLNHFFVQLLLKTGTQAKFI